MVIQVLIAHHHHHQEITIRCMNRWSSWWLNLLEMETRQGRRVRYAYAFCHILSGAALTIGAWYCSKSILVLFWLGIWPIVSLASTMLSLAVHFGLMVHVRWMRWVRLHERKEHAKRRSNDLPMGGLRKGWSWRTLRSYVFMSFVMGVASAALGVGLINGGADLSSRLTDHCGEAGSSRQIEETHRRLASFYDKCQLASPEARGLTAEHCPGYQADFPSPAPYVEYLAHLEAHNGCSGFCHMVGRPLFIPKPPKGQVLEKCSLVIASQLRRVTLAIGAPAIVLGVVGALFDFFLFNFDNL